MDLSVIEKHAFIEHFLIHYRVKQKEVLWLLNYLLKHHQILSHVHFVFEVNVCERGLFIAAECSDRPAFVFYKDKLVSTDVEKAFHDMRMNKHEPLYIELDFLNRKRDIHYMKVLEENPYLPWDFYLSDDDKQSIDNWLETSLYESQKRAIQTQIDAALDRNDEAAFLLYSAQLKSLQVDKDQVHGLRN
ncbi:uncharacterized protein YpiB (UPF0302 family) [Streptohalobacillus salinus]|uniref:Uncharacterized protein YpiB (UPF0302 family) n=1 Tax=Streptohalobacillus salinus TaxID=621096 RepID=A0A2V3WB97_9BACI|nr:ReoY family proteolytic degradation factor [Streptohalobacillus salinus]PXW91733.1 uncharacterized protein YpiB (UPF0302 family) [Streptohalobacillus salinus]